MLLHHYNTGNAALYNDFNKQVCEEHHQWNAVKVTENTLPTKVPPNFTTKTFVVAVNLAVSY